MMSPEEQAAAVCHDEQMTVWTDELLSVLAFGQFLRDPDSYEDKLDLVRFTSDELKRIIKTAFELRAERPSSEELAAPAAPMSNYGSPEWINPYPADPTTGPMVAAPAAPRERERTFEDGLENAARIATQQQLGNPNMKEWDAACRHCAEIIRRALAPSTSGGENG